ncbi:MAG: mandelate racemase/muconate lactonizing enzyme family protein [Phycisphaerae bacterium]
MSVHQTLRIRAIRVTPLAIPMRIKFEHAAATRAVADPVMVELEPAAPAPADLRGWGETLARHYVTGETAATVPATIENVFVPILSRFRAESFAEAIEFADQLPSYDGEQCIHAARAAVELAILDLAGRAFGRRLADAVNFLELRDFGSPGSLATSSYSGIVLGESFKSRCLLAGQRWLGLRDFKIKVAIPGWERRLAAAQRVLGKSIAAGRCTLRADANGGWDLPQAVAALPTLAAAGVSALEQPLPVAGDEHLTELVPRAREHGIDLIADESLITDVDAQMLMTAGVKVMNIRLAKNGGILQAWRLARLAMDNDCDVQLGCLVGETSILTAAGQAFLEGCPRVRFAEGAFGSFLLKADVSDRPLRFGLGGRLRALSSAGLGIDVDADRVQKLAAADATRIIL